MKTDMEEGLDTENRKRRFKMTNINEKKKKITLSNIVMAVYTVLFFVLFAWFYFD